MNLKWWYFLLGPFSNFDCCTDEFWYETVCTMMPQTLQPKTTSEHWRWRRSSSSSSVSQSVIYIKLNMIGVRCEHKHTETDLHTQKERVDPLNNIWKKKPERSKCMAFVCLHNVFAMCAHLLVFSPLFTYNMFGCRCKCAPLPNGNVSRPR